MKKYIVKFKGYIDLYYVMGYNTEDAKSRASILSRRRGLKVVVDYVKESEE